MDTITAIAPDIHWIGMNDRLTDLFEGVWPLPRGVCYNSYLINDDKTAVVETVKELRPETYLDKIRALLPEGKSLDYLIIDHMEPDHSGCIRMLRDVYPGVEIIGNRKTVTLLKGFYGIEDRIRTVQDGDTLELGKHTLQFHLTPMVHWPETMMTYDTTCNVLFSGDAFGGFGALTGGLFDDEVDLPYAEDEILRYFSNIVGKYCNPVQRAIAKLADVDIAIIAPTHGPVWRDNPATIVNLYDRWSRHVGEEGVVLVYGSMYGNTERMMESVAGGLSGEDLSRIRIHNVSTTHISYLIRDAWRFKGIILGGPTYDMGLFPPMQQFVDILKRKQLKDRVLGIFGTYGWSGGGVKTLREFAEAGDWDLVEPVVEAHCCPTKEDLEDCRSLGQNVVQRMRSALAENGE